MNVLSLKKNLRLVLVVTFFAALAIWLLVRLTTHEGLWQSDPDFHPFSTPTPASPPDPHFGTAP